MTVSPESQSVPHVLDAQLDFLNQAQSSVPLCNISRGIEKEGLRVRPSDNSLATTPHPAGLGSPLTNSWVTTDFSEALLEFITPVSSSIKDTLDYLADTHSFAADNLAKEIIWNASMPCRLPADKDIPLASYGTSNIATMKTTYRRGLGHRYGRAMQTVAGIHYNFSLPQSYWELEAETRNQEPDQNYINRRYLDLVRNFRRYYWLLIYLFGCSPCVDPSFVNGRSHKLKSFSNGDLYSPHATSLRMGDLGYQSIAQKSLFICYNELISYIKTLESAMRNPYPPYNIFGMEKEGVFQQLSTSLLQIENEFYSPIRPKRTTKTGEKPLTALNERGIEYIEVRCIDISPFSPLGISKETIHFLDSFLLTCLTLESKPCDENEFAQINENQARVVDTGRKPGLKIFSNNREEPLSKSASQLLSRISAVARSLDNAHGTDSYSLSVESQQSKVADPEQTPSGQLLKNLRDNGSSYTEFIGEVSFRYMQQHRSHIIQKGREDELRTQVAESLKAQHTIEASDTLPFSEFLANYFA